MILFSGAKTIPKNLLLFLDPPEAENGGPWNLKFLCGFVSVMMVHPLHHPLRIYDD